MEAIFFPVPPDALLAALAAAHPEARWRFSLITTVASVAGGVVGYLIGFVAFETIGKPILAATGAASAVLTVQAWFAEQTFLLLLLAAFTPIPYKAFTLTGGALAAPLLPFLLASIIGRGARFFFVAWLSGRYGEQVVRLLLPRINLFLVVVAVGVLLVLVWQLLWG
jgi:membrane protein YqaA with SNARE-associated domain